jgi:succinyl-CoA synthetase beta subunit
MITRLVGTNEEEGQKLLKDADMITATSLANAAEQAVRIAEEGLAI